MKLREGNEPNKGGRPGWLDEGYPVDPESRQVSYHTTPAAPMCE